MKNWINKYLSVEDLESIKSEITAVEKKTLGEIVVSLRERRNLFQKLYKPHEIAVRDFEKLISYKTAQKNGILLFVLFEERFYDILADEGIYSKISDSVWDELESRLEEEFKKGNYLDGICYIIKKMGDILAKEFPGGVGDIDELADEVKIN
ncbi:MAG: TPM domain-containing protein [Ignavibacteria bacterium]